MFCEKCGAKIPDDSRFCDKCGAKILENENNNVEDNFTQTKASNENKIKIQQANNKIQTQNRRVNVQESGLNNWIKNKKKIWIPLLIGLIAVITLVVLYVKVWSLKEVDLNKYVKVKFEGISGEGKAYTKLDTKQFKKDFGLKIKNKYDVDENSEDVLELLYSDNSLNKESKLSNGDKIIVHIVGNEEAVKNYSLRLKFSDKSIKVKNLLEYVNDSKDIDKDSLEKMKEQAQNTIEADLAKMNDSYNKYSLTQCDYKGYILGVAKNFETASDGTNQLYLIYKMGCNVSDGKEKSIQCNYYTYVVYKNLMKKAGKIDVDVSEAEICYDNDVINNDEDYSYYFTSPSGIASYDNMYNEIVTSNKDKYTFIEKVEINPNETSVSNTKEPEKNENEEKIPNSTGGLVFEDSSSRLLSDSEIKALSDDQLQTAMNDIYAKHGYIFKSESLKNHYKSFSWYSEKNSDMDCIKKEFNSTELANIEAMAAERNSR